MNDEEEEDRNLKKLRPSIYIFPFPKDLELSVLQQVFLPAVFVLTTSAISAIVLCTHVFFVW